MTDWSRGMAGVKRGVDPVTAINRGQSDEARAHRVWRGQTSCGGPECS